jgi:DNA topoisomerase-3
LGQDTGCLSNIESLVPTEKGLSVYETVKNKRIADVAMTGSWENSLTQIEKGEMTPDTFGKAIAIYTQQITSELLDTSLSIAGESVCLCPKCKNRKVIFYPKVAKCPDKNCGLVVFRTISDKQLSDSQITDLLTKSKTEVIKGFKSKLGKSFPAALKFDENFRIVYDFPPQKVKK